jgi:hypothetical protein
VRRALSVCALIAIIALCAVAAASAAARTAAACKPGVQKVGKVIYRVYCGPASASVKFEGKTYAFSNGSCVRAGITKVFTLSIGKLTLSKGKPRYSYFGVTVPSANHDGTYRHAIVTWALGGKRHSLSNMTLRLRNDQTRGSFSGRVAGTRGVVTGAFRCK